METLSDKNLSKALRHFKATLDVEMTPAEIQFKAHLDDVLGDTGHKYESQAIFINKKIKKGYIVDFFLPTIKTVFEIDGEYHNLETQKRSDRTKDEYLQSIGITVIRITNNQAINESVKALICKAITDKSTINAITIFTSKRKKRPYWQGTEVISA